MACPSPHLLVLIRSLFMKPALRVAHSRDTEVAPGMGAPNSLRNTQVRPGVLPGVQTPDLGELNHPTRPYPSNSYPSCLTSLGA